MGDPRETALVVATPGDAGLLSNLLELYIHDLSEAFAVDIGPDGRFGYDKLPLYWTEPDRRFAFLIRSGDRIAGFALATRGSPVSSNPDDLDVAEFFVLRRHRRCGTGRRAAFLLWDRLPGRWIVRVSEGNAPGLAFWRRVVAEYANGAPSESRRDGRPHGWRVFTFDSRPAAGGAA
jgi:predicted acetyltransferase